MAFCQYCGTNIGEGMMCNCDGAVQARAAANNPAPAPQVYAAAPQSNQGQASETAKATMNEVSGTLKAFIKDPMAVTASDKDIGLPAALSLLVIQAICFALFVWFFASGARTLAIDKIDKAKITATKNDQTINAYIAEQKVDAKDKAKELDDMLKDAKSQDSVEYQIASMLSSSSIKQQIYEANNLSYNSARFILNLIIASLLSSGVIFALLFLCVKLFKSNDDYTKILSTVSLASIPWSMLWLVFAIVKLITEKSSGTLTALIFALIVFILVASICLLFSGLTKSIQNSYKRLLSASLTYGVGIPLYFWLVIKFFENQPLFGTLIQTIKVGLPL